MRLLVTGGSGYLGSELVRRSGALGLSSADADVRDAAAVDRVLAAHRPDCVVHTAYRQDSADAWAINVDGSRNVAQAARRLGARLLHVSTDVVFDGRAGRPYVETDPTSPITAYGRSKAAAEEAVRDELPEALIVRTSMIYGGPTESVHERTARRAGEVFFTDELRCPIELGDLAAALLELVELDASGPMHVAGGDGVSRCEFARRVAGDHVACGPAPADRPLDCRLDSSLAQSMLRTRLRGLREVLP